MVLINLHGWDYIISDRYYEEMSILFLSSRGTIWAYIYLDCQIKGNTGKPIEYLISGEMWKKIKKELEDYNENNFKLIKKSITDWGMLDKIQKTNTKFGTHFFYFKDLEREDIIKLKTLNVKLIKNLDITVCFQYQRKE